MSRDNPTTRHEVIECGQGATKPYAPGYDHHAEWDAYCEQQNEDQERRMDGERGASIPPDPPLSEIVRLRAAVAYCRMRLKRDAYRDTLDAILRGDKDESIRNPDRTPMVQS